MSTFQPQSGSRKVEPRQKRKRKDSPSRRARTQRRAAERLERIAGQINTTARRRQDAWSAGDQPNVTLRLSGDLDELFEDKRRHPEHRRSGRRS